MNSLEQINLEREIKQELENNSSPSEENPSRYEEVEDEYDSKHPAEIDFWKDVWDDFNREIDVGIPEEKLPWAVLQAKGMRQEKAKDSVDVGKEFDLLVEEEPKDSSQTNPDEDTTYLRPVLPETKPHYYIDNAEKFADRNVWEGIWESSAFEKNSPISSNILEVLCKEEFGAETKVEQKAVIAVGTMSGAIQKTDDKYMLSSCRPDELWINIWDEAGTEIKNSLSEEEIITIIYALQASSVAEARDRFNEAVGNYEIYSPEELDSNEYVINDPSSDEGPPLLTDDEDTTDDDDDSDEGGKEVDPDDGDDDIGSSPSTQTGETESTSEIDSATKTNTTDETPEPATASSQNEIDSTDETVATSSSSYNLPNVESRSTSERDTTSENTSKDESSTPSVRTTGDDETDTIDETTTTSESSSTISTEDTVDESTTEPETPQDVVEESEEEQPSSEENQSQPSVKGSGDDAATSSSPETQADTTEATKRPQRNTDNLDNEILEEDKVDIDESAVDSHGSLSSDPSSQSPQNTGSETPDSESSETRQKEQSDGTESGGSGGEQSRTSDGVDESTNEGDDELTGEVEGYTTEVDDGVSLSELNENLDEDSQLDIDNEENEINSGADQTERDESDETTIFQTYEEPDLDNPAVDVDIDAIAQFIEHHATIGNEATDEMKTPTDTMISTFTEWAKINDVKLDGLDPDIYIDNRKGNLTRILTNNFDVEKGQQRVDDELKRCYYPIAIDTNVKEIIN